MKTIKLDLTVNEVNLLFKALGRMPFAEVYELIGKINLQANEQLQGSGQEQLNLKGTGDHAGMN